MRDTTYDKQMNKTQTCMQLIKLIGAVITLLKKEKEKN